MREPLSESAFEAVVETYYRPLCVFAESYVRSPDVAEEIVQEVLLWLWRRRHEAQPRELVAYVYAAVRNRSLNHVRDRRRVDRWTASANSDFRVAGVGQPAPGPEEAVVYLSGDASHRSHLAGAYGLFGSVVVEAVKTVQVTGAAPQEWTLASPATGFPSRLLFYLAAVHLSDTSLSGRYQFAGDTTTRGMLGRLGKDSVYIDLLPDWVGTDTRARFAGTISESSMILRSTQNGTSATYTPALK